MPFLLEVRCKPDREPLPGGRRMMTVCVAQAVDVLRLSAWVLQRQLEELVPHRTGTTGTDPVELILRLRWVRRGPGSGESITVLPGEAGWVTEMEVESGDTP